MIKVANDAFDMEKEDGTGRILHVPMGTAARYQSSLLWRHHFETITEY